MTLDALIPQLERLAPPRLAADWDNTGLLLEGDRTIHRVLLTIDLTEAVCAEAIELDVDMVIAYHPPIFRGLTSLTRSTSQGRSLLRLLRRGVHLYSPHTALDAVAGGMNDWLLEAFEGAQGLPIQADAIDANAGLGRVASVAARTGAEHVAAIKAHLGLDTVRVAGPLQASIDWVAVCPGSGSSVFRGLKRVGLLLTGEMGHHDVLAWVERGVVVVLTEHSNTERGYLPRLAAGLKGVDVRISRVDRDPLTVH